MALALAAAAWHGSGVVRAAGATWAPFLTLGIVIGAGLALDAAGVFRLLARLLMPAAAPAWLVSAGALGFTALLSSLVNLDVAVVVALPMVLVVARERSLPAPALALAAALTANATSFLLPTSNLTTLLVLQHAPLGAAAYLREAWLAWLLVTALTVPALTLLVHGLPGTRRSRTRGAVPAGSRGTRPAGDRPPRITPVQALMAVLDLAPLFVAAVAIRALLGGGVAIQGGVLRGLGIAGGLAAGVNNLPAAASVVATQRTSAWGAILGLALGPNLVLTGSVASLIARRIARDGSAGFGAVRFSLVGVTILPLQILLALLGLRLTGAL